MQTVVAKGVMGINETEILANTANGRKQFKKKKAYSKLKHSINLRAAIKKQGS